MVKVGARREEQDAILVSEPQPELAVATYCDGKGTNILPFLQRSIVHILRIIGEMELIIVNNKRNFTQRP